MASFKRFVLFCLMVTFFGECYSQSSLIKGEPERVVLMKLNAGQSVANKNYHLSTYGDSLVFLDGERLKKDKILDFYTIYNNAISFHYSIRLDEKLFDLDSRYQLMDFAVVENDFYLIYSNFCFIVKVTGRKHYKNITQLKFKNPFDGIQIDNGKVYFSRSKKYSSLKKNENNLQVGRVVKSEVKPVFKFDTDSYYLLHFESRNHFIVNNDVIYYTPPGEPKIEEYFITNDSSYVTTSTDNWYSPLEVEISLFNKLSDRNPNAMFSEVVDKIDFISYNLRLDKIDSIHFGLTYFLGDTSDVNGYCMDIWTFSNESMGMTKVKSLSINAGQKESLDENGHLHMGFHNSDRYNFCYLNGKRYQLAVEPKADWSNRNAERIKEERNKSMLNNQFELCLYIGTLDLD